MRLSSSTGKFRVVCRRNAGLERSYARISNGAPTGVIGEFLQQIELTHRESLGACEKDPKLQELSLVGAET